MMLHVSHAPASLPQVRLRRKTSRESLQENYPRHKLSVVLEQREQRVNLHSNTHFHMDGCQQSKMESFLPTEFWKLVVPRLQCNKCAVLKVFWDENR